MIGLDQNPEGLPEINRPRRDMEAIDLLRPGTDHHSYVLNYLLERIKASETEMTNFYPRWQVAERKFQAYLNLPKYEQMLREMNDKSKVPGPHSISVQIRCDQHYRNVWDEGVLRQEAVLSSRG